MPLALHGVVVKADGERVDIAIGEKPEDPVLYITDLLPHLDRGDKKASELAPGEKLNAIVGSVPLDEEEKDAVKLGVLKLLYETYGITEEDFLSAELSLVPAEKARDVGFDRSLISAYGHDDRCCAYPSLTAMIDADESLHTTMCILIDKEETGSDGVTGMQSHLFMDLVKAISDALGGNEALVRANSKCLSSDVTAIFDPDYPEVFEKRNAAIVAAVKAAPFTPWIFSIVVQNLFLGFP